MPLSRFHPIIQAWFARRFQGPTEAQALGWPAIAQGQHTLIAAPTGSGKTLAAFLNCLDSLVRQGLEHVAEAVDCVSEEMDGSFEDLEVMTASATHRLRVSSRSLESQGGERLGRVILFKEISHEPLRRNFEELLVALSQHGDGLRKEFKRSLDKLSKLGEQVASSGITSPSMSFLSERVTRTQTAISSWLEIDDLMCREDYPDAQLLIERMRLANKRWPQSVEVPVRVLSLGKLVESYYESGVNPKERVL
ncbi:MAG: DEAD/DEAH box helicase [Myxococcales bacterium]|nr:DEAD/DEAH box helicase [Myxococcales bacterium]